MTVPEKLRLLAQWFELEQLNRPEWHGKDVQDDLRWMADEWERKVDVIKSLSEELNEISKENTSHDAQESENLAREVPRAGEEEGSPDEPTL